MLKHNDYDDVRKCGDCSTCRKRSKKYKCCICDEYWKHKQCNNEDACKSVKYHRHSHDVCETKCIKPESQPQPPKCEVYPNDGKYVVITINSFENNTKTISS